MGADYMRLDESWAAARRAGAAAGVDMVLRAGQAGVAGPPHAQPDCGAHGVLGTSCPAGVVKTREGQSWTQVVAGIMLSQHALQQRGRQQIGILNRAQNRKVSKTARKALCTLRPRPGAGAACAALPRPWQRPVARYKTWRGRALWVPRAGRALAACARAGTLPPKRDLFLFLCGRRSAALGGSVGQGM